MYEVLKACAGACVRKKQTYGTHVCRAELEQRLSFSNVRNALRLPTSDPIDNDKMPPNQNEVFSDGLVSAALAGKLQDSDKLKVDVWSLSEPQKKA